MKFKAKNEHRRALFSRAGTADQAIAVDTRPRRIAGAKTYNRKKARKMTDVIDE